MMTLQLDMTSQLAAIPYGLVIGLAVALLGLLAQVSRKEIRPVVGALAASYCRARGGLRRGHVSAIPPLATSRAH